MVAFCRQRAALEYEDDAFWIREAEEWDKLIAEYASRQVRTGRATQSGSGVADDWDGAQLFEQ